MAQDTFKAISKAGQQVILDDMNAALVAATGQADEATTQAGIATTQAGNALTQANRSEDEADRAEAERELVQNAVDAFDQSNNALLGVSILQDAVAELSGQPDTPSLRIEDLAQKIGEPVYIPTGEPANGTIPAGYALLFLDGSELKFKLSNNTVITL